MTHSNETTSDTTRSPTALVTGAGSGIGRQTSGALAAAGFHVVLSGRREEALQETIQQYDAAASMTAIACDVTDERHADRRTHRGAMAHRH